MSSIRAPRREDQGSSRGLYMYSAFDHSATVIKPAAYLLRLGLRKPKQPKPKLLQLSQKFSSVTCYADLLAGDSGEWGPVQLPARLEARKEDGSMPQGYRQASLGRRPACHKTSPASSSRIFFERPLHCIFPKDLKWSRAPRMYNKHKIPLAEPTAPALSQEVRQ